MQNLEQIYALEHLFQSSTPVQAARTVLSGQLLSGGISLRKEGEDVELTPEFKQHLHEVWIPFAQDIIDSMLKWGICCVSYEEQVEDSRRSVLMAKRRKAAQPPPILRGKGSRAAKAAAAAAADAAAAAVPPVVVPVVPLLGTYEIAYVHGGRQGYTREYLVYSNAPGQGTREDEEARVFVKQHPDSAGNVNSPLASVFELGSFVGALTELAITAESCRARPRMVTQMRKKDTAQLDPGNLFFDSESRAVQAGADHDDNAHQARALQFQQSMCDMINRLQTRQPKHDHDLHSFGGQGRLHNAGKAPYAPPEVPPSLFTVPKVAPPPSAQTPKLPNSQTPNRTLAPVVSLPPVPGRTKCAAATRDVQLRATPPCTHSPPRSVGARAQHPPARVPRRPRGAVAAGHRAVQLRCARSPALALGRG